MRVLLAPSVAKIVAVVIYCAILHGNLAGFRDDPALDHPVLSITESGLAKALLAIMVKLCDFLAGTVRIVPQVVTCSGELIVSVFNSYRR